MRKNKFLWAMAIVAFIASCQDDEVVINTPNVSTFSSAIARDYFTLEVTLVKETPGLTPPVASRAYGYAGLTLYESLVHGMPAYNSLVGQVTDLSSLSMPEANKEYHWPAVANAAMASILRSLFPTATATNLAAIDQMESSNEAIYATSVADEILQRSILYGETIAGQIFDFSKTDSGHEGYLRNFPGYTIPAGSTWSDSYTTNGALQPTWGSNRTFVPDCATLTQPETGPTAYSEEVSSPFYQEAQLVYDVSQEHDPEKEAIARFWSDDPGITGTPPGHSISILTQVLALEDANLEDAAQAYAKVGMAVSDAFVSCWKSKYITVYLRPLNFIPEFIDAGWTPLLNTPPFPEFTSGHSVQSGATAEILESLYGVNYAFTDHTHEGRADIGNPVRSYSSFQEFADEAAISRLYGGIHFMPAIDIGVAQGREVGKEILKLDFNN